VSTLPLLKEQLLESQEKLLQAYTDLMAASEEKKEREAAMTEAREVSEKAKEEVVQLRERTASAEEAASKAREEAARYKGVAAELDEEKNLVKSDLASAWKAYREIKEGYVKSEIARSTAEGAEKKAHEDLKAERIRSRSLSNDVDRLMKMLLEKEGAILRAGNMIEDLRVANTDQARSYKEIERANTDLVGENTALKEKICGKYDLAFVFLLVKLLSRAF
jgi:chromosome segregation ATPase